MGRGGMERGTAAPPESELLRDQFYSLTAWEQKCQGRGTIGRGKGRWPRGMEGPEGG